MEAVAVYSDADADAQHVATADAAVRLGPAPPAESYLAHRRDRRGRPGDRRRRDPSRATGSSPNGPPSPGPSRTRASSSSGPSSDAIDALGDKLACPPHWRGRSASTGLPGTLEPAPVDRPDARRQDRRRGRGDRLPDPGQGGGRRRGTRDAPGRRRPRTCPAALAAGSAEALAGLRRRVGLPRARDPAGPPHRGPAPGRRDRPRHRARRARLLAPAPPPEARRGGARARADHRGAPRPPRPGGPRSRRRPGCATPRRAEFLRDRPTARSTSSRSTRGSRSSTA